LRKGELRKGELLSRSVGEFAQTESGTSREIIDNISDEEARPEPQARPVAQAAAGGARVDRCW
jgi:hypothetical protein